MVPFLSSSERTIYINTANSRRNKKQAIDKLSLNLLYVFFDDENFEVVEGDLFYEGALAEACLGRLFE